MPSRLNRQLHEKNKKQSIFFGILIIVLLFVLFQLGPGILNMVSQIIPFSSTPKEDKLSENTNLEAPFINYIPEATNSARINIEGSAPYSDAKIQLFVNAKLYDDTFLSDDQKFIFKNVTLTNGSNIIKARVKKGTATSNFTREYIVKYNADDAKLEVSSPTDGQEFTRGDQSIAVTGKTDSTSTVTVNSFRAIVDGDGNFSYYLSLNEGDNKIKIEATSESGKTITKELSVKYKP